MFQAVKGSGAVLLEANHDRNLLDMGRYPLALKQRIRSDKGHLSNEDSGRLLCRIFGKKLKYAFLSHLSKENNYPALAYEAVKCQIWEDTGIKELPFKLAVAKRDEPSELVTL